MDCSNVKKFISAILKFYRLTSSLPINSEGDNNIFSMASSGQISENWLIDYARSPIFPEFDHLNVDRVLSHLSICQICRKRLSRFSKKIAYLKKQNKLPNLQIMANLIGVPKKLARCSQKEIESPFEFVDKKLTFNGPGNKIKSASLVFSLMLLFSALTLLFQRNHSINQDQDVSRIKNNFLINSKYIPREDGDIVAISGGINQQQVDLFIKKKVALFTRKALKQSKGASQKPRSMQTKMDSKVSIQQALILTMKIAGLDTGVDHSIQVRILNKYRYLRVLKNLFPNDPEIHLDLAIFARMLGKGRESMNHVSHALRSQNSLQANGDEFSKENLDVDSQADKQIASRLIWQRIEEKTSKLERSLKYNPYHKDTLKELSVIYAGMGFPVLAEHYHFKWKI